MPRLYVKEALAAHAEIHLPAEQAHYLRNVMRMKEGQTLALFNGHDGEWQARVSVAEKKHVVLRCERHQRPQRNSLPLTVCFAPVKGGRVEGMIEKATELGASRIIPVKTTRTVARHLNIERLSLIAREAAEQSERMDVPEIMPFTPLATLLAEWPEGLPLLYGDESGASPRAALGGDKPQAWGTLSGPEGGFSPEEFAMLMHCKAAQGVGLGPRILRADTACTTLIAITAQCWGDWDEAPHFNPPD
jgi:16S rRNA (uracil1498-N3)-methyltransferase